MPYYVHAKDTTLEALTDAAGIIDAQVFGHRGEAYAYAKGDKTLTVTFCASEHERQTWQNREYRRMNSEYQQVPWASFWLPLNSGHREAWQKTQYHYCHLSVKQPGLVAYTPTDEHGIQDRQVSLRPGKYLEEFFAFVPLEQRQEWIAQCVVRELKIATTPDDIEAIYRGKHYTGRSEDDECECDLDDDDGCTCDDSRLPFQSCMGPDAHTNHWEYAHPTRVYGNSDLAVAWFGDDIHAVKARCVVWPEKKRYSRIYGEHHALKVLMQAAGYEEGSMEGARIRAICANEASRIYLMPYIDVASYAELTPCGEFFKLGSGSTTTSETSGYVYLPRTYTCTRCAHTYRDNRRGDENTEYCPDCLSRRYTCASCAETHWDGSYQYLDTVGNVCPTCVKDKFTSTCIVESCGATWVELAMRSTPRTRRELNGYANIICLACESSGLVTVCHSCKTPYQTLTLAAAPQMRDIQSDRQSYYQVGHSYFATCGYRSETIQRHSCPNPACYVPTRCRQTMNMFGLQVGDRVRQRSNGIQRTILRTAADEAARIGYTARETREVLADYDWFTECGYWVSDHADENSSYSRRAYLVERI